MSAVILTPADSRIVLLRSAAGYRVVRPSGYVLPVATSSALGGVKVGSGLSVAGDGTLSAVVTSASIGDSTATGRSLLTAADAAAARTAIGAGVGNALTSGTLGQFAATTSAELAGVLTDETGSGSVVFSASPTLTGTVVVRQTGGTAGTDELQVSHDGSRANLSDRNAAKGRFLFTGTGGDCILMFGGTGSQPALRPNGQMLQAMRADESNNAPLTASEFRVTYTSNLGGWVAGNDPTTALTLGLARLDDNTIEVNNGTRTASGGALRGLSVSSLTATAPVTFNATAGQDTLLIRSATGQFPIRVRNAADSANALTVDSNGTVTSGGTIETAVGIRVTTFGAYMGVLGSTRFQFQNGRIETFGVLQLGTYTVATLPSASANAGAFAQVTDSNSTTNGNTVAGGGANRVPVFSNGTNWIIK